jgi:hypothetical protein
VLLHETIHATGPAARDDVRETPSGRALEEGFTEAATVDLLPRMVRTLGLPGRLTSALLASARRYRPAYSAQVGWVRLLAARATGQGAMSPAAAAWRVAAADGWGSNRWSLLADATGRTEQGLRAEAPEIRTDGTSR